MTFYECSHSTPVGEELTIGVSGLEPTTARWEGENVWFEVIGADPRHTTWIVANGRQGLKISHFVDNNRLQAGLKNVHQSSQATASLVALHNQVQLAIYYHIIAVFNA